VDIDFDRGFTPDPTGDLTALPQPLAGGEVARRPLPKNLASALRALGFGPYCVVPNTPKNKS